MKRSLFFGGIAGALLASALLATNASAQLTQSKLFIENGSNIMTITGAGAGSITMPAVTGTAITDANLSLITSTGTLTGLTVTNPISGSILGNAGTVTNGVYTTGAYADPSWITHINFSILDGTVPTWNQSTTGNAATATALATAGTTTTVLHGNASGAPSYGPIVDADITAATITDDKLSTISTAGKVSNSATTATSTNTNSAIVARDGSGNFSAGTITAALTGNASTATTLQTARTINGTSFDGSGNITVTAAAGTLTGSTLASGVTASSLTSVGTLTGLTVSAAPQITPWTTAGVIHNAASTGILSSSLILDADVSSSAAIAGTKINPNFGTQAVTTSGNISATGSGTITSAGLLTASDGLTVSSGTTSVTGATNINTSGSAGTSIGLASTGGTVSIVSGSTTGSIDNMTVGATTAATGKFTTAAVTTNSSGTPSANTIYKDNMVNAWGNIPATGTSATAQFGISSYTHTNTTGTYVLTLDNQLATANHGCIQVTIGDAGSASTTNVGTADAEWSTASTITVHTWTLNNGGGGGGGKFQIVAADHAFFIQVLQGQ